MAVIMDPRKCLPCVNEEHAKILHAKCASPGCAVKASFCYLSFLGPVQAFRCPAHSSPQDELSYRLQGLAGTVPVTPAFHPAQERW